MRTDDSLVRALRAVDAASSARHDRARIGFEKLKVLALVERDEDDADRHAEIRGNRSRSGVIWPHLVRATPGPVDDATVHARQAVATNRTCTIEGDDAGAAPTPKRRNLS
jgi:hypothetical protein